MIKLSFSILLLLLSLLVLLPAPNIFFWKLAIGITQYPHIAFFVSFIMIMVGFKSANYSAAICIVNIVASIIFLLPILEIVQNESNVKSALNNVFPIKTDNKFPPFFSLIKMFYSSPKVPYNTFVYKNIDKQNLTLDYYATSSNLPSPLVIVIHGGSWLSGDSQQLPELNSVLANQGYNVATINYRLAPAYKAPAPIDDTRDAIQFFIRNAAKLNIDTNNIVLLGRSAGAQIALCAAYNFHLPNIKGVISYYGPADMVWAGQLKPNAGVLNNNEIYNSYLGGLYKDVPDNFKAASAVYQVDAGSPPTLIIHGKIDPLVFYTHADHLEKKLIEFNIPHYYLQFNFATHGCDYNLQSPHGQACTYSVLHFIQSVVGK